LLGLYSVFLASALLTTGDRNPFGACPAGLFALNNEFDGLAAGFAFCTFCFATCAALPRAVFFAAAADVPGTRPDVALFAGDLLAVVVDLAALALAAAADAPGARPAVLDFDAELLEADEELAEDPPLDAAFLAAVCAELGGAGIYLLPIGENLMSSTPRANSHAEDAGMVIRAR
jgi:hypothetical protein